MHFVGMKHTTIIIYNMYCIYIGANVCVAMRVSRKQKLIYIP